MTRAGEVAEPVTFREARAEDAERLDAAQRRLSADLGDPHRSSAELLRRMGLGSGPVFRAILAERGLRIAGFALASPVLSTVRGGSGAFVSDLWVEPEMRGAGLGARLLAETARVAAARWGALYLKLAVYDDNPGARVFYDRLGFEPADRQTTLILADPALVALRQRHGSPP